MQPVERAQLHDAITGDTTPCHLYFIYADDETIPDVVLEKTIIHVDLAASEAEPNRLEVRDCRPLQPHVRLHGAMLEDTPKEGPAPSPSSTLQLYGFVKPREEPPEPEAVLEDFDRRNKAIRAALLRGGGKGEPS